MVRICESSIRSQFFDELNISHERNLNNTPRTSFNCAGFALGTYSWYCPREGESEWKDYAFETGKQAYEATQRSIDCMLKDFPTLRVLDCLDRGRNGIWYHKRGRTKKIDIMPKKLIFKVWCRRYDGPIVMMAKKWDK